MSTEMINECCICGGAVETKKILPFRNLIGSGVETWDMHIAICNECGFIFQQNPFTPEQLEDRYKNFSKYEFDSEDYVLDESADYKVRCLRQKNFIDEQLSSDGYNSVLEIGAASGYNLSLYSDKRRLGIEPSAKNCKLAKKFYGVDMFNGMWDRFRASSDQKFDLIFMSHVLEHIVNPMKFINECAALCNRYMFIEVPCLDVKFIDEPFGMFAEEHVNVFTVRGLWSLMHRAGFSPINYEIPFGLHQYLPAGWPAISTLWIKSNSPEVPSPLTNTAADVLKKYIVDNEKLLLEIDNKIKMIPRGEKLAVWGVGHHISMLLANTALVNKNIVRVYDSDRRKHHHKVCGVPVTAFDPEDISSGAVDSILITTYTAQCAIKKFIDRQNLACKVYTLYDLP